MIGSTVSHYHILSKLGEGGMGVVYEAEDTRLKRRVALKFLSGDLGAPQDRARFVREAQAAALLDHPNICTVYEIDDSAESTFISMALVEGDTLRKRMEGGPLPLEESLDLALQAAEGLSAAHARGVVHRDVKPANLMVGPDGRLQITDFGLAKLADATQITRTASTLGTPSYMAPEQVRGADVDVRADVWSVGVLLYEMLSGQRPFPGDSAQAVLYSILESDPRPLQEVAPDAPESLAWIVDRCLAKDPQTRYPDAGELAADLRTVRTAIASGTESTLQIHAGPRPELGATTGGARRWVQGAVAILVLLSVVVLALRWWPSPLSPEPQSWSDPPRAVVLDFDNRTGDPALDPLAQRTRDAVTQQLVASDLVELVPVEAGGTDADVVVTGAYFLEGNTVELGGAVRDARNQRLVFAVPRLAVPQASPGAGITELAQRITGGLAMELDNPLRNHYGGVPPTFTAFEQYRGALASLLDLQLPRIMPQLDRAIALDPRFRRPMAFKAFLLAGSAPEAAERYITSLDSLRPGMDDFDRLVLDYSLATARKDNLALLGRAREWHERWPQDVGGTLGYVNLLFEFNRPREAVEIYEALEIPDDLRRRPWVAQVGLRGIGSIYHALGHFDEELAQRQSLVASHPDDPHLHLDLAFPHAAMGDLAAVQSTITRCIALPNTSQGQLDWTTWTSCAILRSHGHPDAATELANWYIEQRLGIPRPGMDEFLSGDFLANNLALLLYHAGRLDDARRLFEESVAQEVQADTARLWIALLQATQGDRASVEEFQRAFVEPWQAKPDAGAAPYLWRARYAAALGDREEALQHLREAGARGLRLNHHRLYHEPGLENLLGYPPFEELVAPKG